MIKLYRQGFYREMPHGEKTDPSIHDSIIPNQEVENREEICQYLDSAKIFISCSGVSMDIIHPERGIAGVPSLFTDGKWVWPGDLAYYVRNYNLQLEDAFVEYMKQKNWKPQIVSIPNEDIVIE